MRTITIISAEIITKKQSLTKALKALDADQTSQQNKDKVDELKKEIATLDAEREDLKKSKKLEADETNAIKKKLDDEAKDIAKKAKKKQDAEDEARKAEEVSKFMAVTHHELIEQHDIVQIIGTDGFYIKQDENLVPRTFTQLHRDIFSFKNKADENIFFDVMRSEDRNYNWATFDFHNTKTRYFNLAQNVEKTWLQIGAYDGLLTEYKCPTAIDILMTSLSAGNSKARLHLEECIIRKRRHPGDYRIPSLLAYGQGGAGRNEFVTDLLSIIFKNSTKVTNFKTLVDNPFMLLGQVVVLCDETISSQSSYDKFKAIAGNKEILMKKLFEDVYSVPNVMWLFIVGNGLNGPLAISNDSTTRRLSAIKYSRDLLQWLGDYLEEPFVGDDEQVSRFNEVWAQMKKDDFTDAKVGEWLNYLNAKFPLDRPVPAYHEEDFDDMVNAHKTPIETVIDSVLVMDYSRKPQAITFATLYEIYKLTLKEKFGGRKDQGVHKFYGSLKAIAERGMIPGWSYKQRQFWKVNGRRFEAPSMINEDVAGTINGEVDDSIYITTSENGNYTKLAQWQYHDDTVGVATGPVRKFTNTRDF